MRRILLFVGAIAIVAACGGSTEPDPIITKPKPDPYLVIRVAELARHDDESRSRELGRMYALLSGPSVNLNGVDRVLQHDPSRVCGITIACCIRVGADSVGQRLIVHGRDRRHG
jgi:hypothetical protein